VTRHETFDNIQDWLKDIRDHAMEDVLIYLIGNKSDSDDKEVTASEALAFAESNQIHKFFETSAKTGDAVDDVFSIATKDMLKRGSA
jgi:GTPase SAR1 family protein